MAATPPTLPDLHGLDAAALKALILTQHENLVVQHETLLSRETEIEYLKLLILKLRRMQFGRKSEKLDRHIEQLELRLEDLESAQTASTSPKNDECPQAAAASSTARRPARRPLPDHLPRETQTHIPDQTTCPECGGTLRQFAEDVSELLEFVPARCKVIRIVRPKLSCAGCAHIVQAAAPSRPVDRGLAGPGLLAHVLVSKYLAGAEHHEVRAEPEVVNVIEPQKPILRMAGAVKQREHHARQFRVLVIEQAVRREVNDPVAAEIAAQDRIAAGIEIQGLKCRPGGRQALDFVGFIAAEANP